MVNSAGMGPLRALPVTLLRGGEKAGTERKDREGCRGGEGGGGKKRLQDESLRRLEVVSVPSSSAQEADHSQMRQVRENMEQQLAHIPQGSDVVSLSVLFRTACSRMLG